MHEVGFGGGVWCCFYGGGWVGGEGGCCWGGGVGLCVIDSRVCGFGCEKEVVDGVDVFSFAFVSGLSIRLFSSSNPPTSLPIASPRLASPPLP